MVYQLDDYERAFIEKKKEVTPHSESIMQEILKLFDNCIKKALTSLETATGSKLAGLRSPPNPVEQDCSYDYGYCCHASI